jgi:Holliday junction DNA helicase RuvA
VIAYIKGIVAYTTANSCVIDVGGVGYNVYVAHPYNFVQEQSVLFYTFHYIKEDVDALYGFLTREELQTYERLLSVKGIGPKVAMTVVAATTPAQLMAAIETGDVNYLRKIPGIGPKAAGQIIFDLKGKIVSTEQTTHAPVLQDASEALKALGYTQKEIAFAFKNIEAETLSVEALVRVGLKNLMG